jgi:xanthine/CO dehydrogenase XdhC/CoxF family maturation factor
MLVLEDGTTIGELSGGCPQRDLVARAQEAMVSASARIARYNRDSSLDVLMEMGCGGELDVLIEPLDGAADTGVFDHCLRESERRQNGVLATLVATAGTVSAHPHRLLRFDDGFQSGAREFSPLREAVCGGRLQDSASCAMLTVPSAVGTCDVFVERIRPVHCLAVVGVNSASIALANLAATLGWRVTVVRHEPEPAEVGVPLSVPAVIASPADVSGRIVCDGASSVVVMTFNLERDIAYLEALSKAPLAYLGAVASRERAAVMRERAGAAIRTPAGLDLGSETPNEIAVSIAAEILAALNARSGSPLSTISSPIHAR